MTDKIRARLSDGLKNIDPDEVTDIIIAGMGGELIAKIISDAVWTKDNSKRLILQPMSRPEYLREFLYTNGYNIEREKCVISENRLYSVINAAYSDTPVIPTSVQKYMGEIKRSDDARLYDMYSEKVTQHLKQKASGYAHSGNITDHNEILKIIRELEG